MIVKELIELLQDLHPDEEVCFFCTPERRYMKSTGIDQIRCQTTGKLVASFKWAGTAEAKRIALRDDYFLSGREETEQVPSGLKRGRPRKAKRGAPISVGPYGDK